MFITLKTKINESILRKMASFQLLKLRRANFIIMTVALTIGIVTSIYAIITEEEKTVYILILAILPLLYLFLYVLSPMLTSKATLKRLKLPPGETIIYQYQFKDNDFDVTLFYGTVEKAQSTIEYSSVKRLYQWKEFIYIVMKESYAFVISRTDNTQEDINKVYEHIVKKTSLLQKVDKV